jgi:alkylation response protein AidB-like acyl-CoA dehydrogenase
MSISFCFNEDVEEFREHVRSVLTGELSDDIRAKVSQERIDLSREDQQAWHRVLHSHGWGGTGLPPEYGGPGWSDEQYFVFLRELGRADAPRPMLYGLKMVAPTLIKFGSETQRRRYLPDIVSGEKFWCQAFSEPDAGSDLAALKCAASRDGSHYVITGSKTWISDAHHADIMFGLFRTERTARRQDGITALILDMNSPGITVRPLPNYEGTHECNEIFFDSVRVPFENRIGDEGGGWTVAKYLLGVERFDTAEIARSLSTVERIRHVISERSGQFGSSVDTNRRWTRLAELEIELRALAATEGRYVLGTPQESQTGAEASLLKWLGTEVQQDLLELLMDSYGETSQAGLPSRPVNGATSALPGGFAARAFHRYRVSTIYAGSTEIQKNLIARLALALKD